MKFKILLSSILATSIIVSGCSSKTENTTTQSAATPQTSNNDKQSTIINEGGLHSEEKFKKETSVSKENNAFKVTITGIKLSTLSFDNTFNAQRLQSAKLEANTEYTSVLLRINIENKLTKNADINPNTSHLLIKDTKEQVEQNQYIAGWKETTYLPGAEKEMTILFIAKKSKVNDIKNISLNIDSPYTQGEYTRYESLTVDLNNIQ